MKNIFTLVLTVLVLNASAQKLAIGLKGGTAHTTVIDHSKRYDSMDMLNSYNISLAVEYNFCPGFYFGGGAMYNQRGYENGKNTSFDAGYETTSTTTSSYKYDYISLPLYLGVKANKKLYPFFNAGVLASRPINVTRSLKSNDPLALYPPSGSYKYETKVIDYALITELGVGYQLCNKMSATLSATYIRDMKSQLPEKFHGVLTNLGVKYIF